MSGQDPITFNTRTAPLDGSEKFINPAATPEELITTDQVKDYVLAAIQQATLTGTIVTFADGQTYDLQHIADTDTFATVSGNVITFANGDTLNVSGGGVDTFATLGGSVITFADGQTTDLATIDTDTFASLAGNVITFANGDTVAIVDTDTFASLAGTVITFANGDTLDVQSIDTDTFATLSGSTITFPNGNTITVPTDSFYDAGQGFWVMGTAGITVTLGAAGAYTMDIPANAKLDFYHKNFENSNIGTELDASGNFTLTMNWNQANTSWKDAILPSISGFGNGEEYFIGATGQAASIGISVQHSEPSGGSYTSSFTGVSGSIGGKPIQIKGSF